MDDTPANSWCVHLWEGGRLPPSTTAWQALNLMDPIWTAARLHMDANLFAEEVHCNLGTFTFFASHLFSTSRRKLTVVTELLRLIGRL